MKQDPASMFLTESVRAVDQNVTALIEFPDQASQTAFGERGALEAPLPPKTVKHPSVAFDTLWRRLI
jgi:hypothetical protein